MDKKIVMISIAAVIGIIVLGSVLMPILDEATATTDTFTNEGYFYMEKLASSDDTEHTLSWVSTDSKILTVDGVDMDITTWGLSSYQQVTVFATETDLVRLGVTSVGFGLQWIQIRGATISYASAGSNFDATISNGSASIMLDTETDPRELTYTDAYIIQPDKSDYVMKKMNDSAYMNSDSPIYSLGYTALSYGGGNDNAVLKVSGDVKEVNVTAVRQSSAYELTFSNITIDKSTVSGYNDLYSFKKITFVATENSTANDCTYSYVIVPHEVTAERSVHFTAGQNAIFAAIPVLIILAVLLGVVALVIRSRMD